MSVNIAKKNVYRIMESARVDLLCLADGVVW